MRDLKDKVIENLLEQIKDLKEKQYISKSNEVFFIELSEKLGGFNKINNNKYIKLKYSSVECDTFADLFLILVNEYIDRVEINKGEE
jgi:hypothetical protein